MTTNSAGWNLDNSYARLPSTLYAELPPVPVKAPTLVRLNERLAAELGLDPESLRSAAGAALFSGNMLPIGARPIAEAYAGHQYGHFTMLGDGRAILIGEQITPAGARRDLHLKGSGRTPFSRGGDGRAALAPMLREYLMSESMHALGIPSSRSLAVTATGEEVYRQEGALAGAVLCRVASSHIRVGTFQYAALSGGAELLATLAEYTLSRHFPRANRSKGLGLALLDEVIASQAELITKWMLVGFIHGVMNTDNMFLSGETVDFGPCAFMDTYDPETVFSSIDRYGRYAYGNQPAIAQWNLSRFAESLLPVIDERQETAIEKANESLRAFETSYGRAYLAGMRSKLGIFNIEEGDGALVDEFLGILLEQKIDYTNAFHELEKAISNHARPATNSGRAEDNQENIEHASSSSFSSWHARWTARLERQSASHEESLSLMKSMNPRIIPRNHLVEHALASATAGDWKPWDALLCELATPFVDSPTKELFTQPAPQEFTRAYKTFCGT